MKTTVEIDGTDFVINGRKTYAGRVHEGRRVEGLLLNARMIQAIFDDEHPQTRELWAYPDTGRWDPERNTDEFCAALPTYRAYGLLGVTVGLQAGGPLYTAPAYDTYVATAFRPDGSLKDAWLQRLHRVLRAADDAGLVVIVNYFYWRQERFESEAAVKRATENATRWLLETGFRNVMVDVRNEIKEAEALLQSRRVHELMRIVRETTRDGRRLLVGVSTHPENHLPAGEWPAYADFFMPHGNDQQPERWRRDLRAFKESSPMRERPRPVMCNEDSTFTENLDVSVDEGCSWGYYSQGYGAGAFHGKFDWGAKPRETRYEELSGFQTLPVNWGINTEEKRKFFGRVKEITGA